MDFKQENHNIITFCGAKVTDHPSANCKMWVVPRDNPLYGVVNNHIVIGGQPWFEKSWDKLMPVVEYISKIEGLTLIETLNKLAGKKGNSLMDVYENVIEYIKTKK